MPPERWFPPDWRLKSVTTVSLWDHSLPLSADSRQCAVETFPLIRKAAGRQTLHRKRQEDLLLLEAPALLSGSLKLAPSFSLWPDRV